MVYGIASVLQESIRVRSVLFHLHFPSHDLLHAPPPRSLKPLLLHLMPLMSISTFTDAIPLMLFPSVHIAQSLKDIEGGGEGASAVDASHNETTGGSMGELVSGQDGSRRSVLLGVRLGIHC